MVEATTTNPQRGGKVVRSKYMMLEIFSYLWTRREAIYNLRMLNRRFLQYRKDPYLENFSQDRATEMLYYEVRAEEDLEHFKRLVKYGKIMESVDCLVIDCFYDFGHYKEFMKPMTSEEKQAYQAKWSKLAHLLASAPRY